VFPRTKSIISIVCPDESREHPDSHAVHRERRVSSCR
jgi:hypothetical protein